jgi:adenosylhomocysteine nucleosidase
VSEAQDQPEVRSVADDGVDTGRAGVDAVVVTAMADEAEPFLQGADSVGQPVRHGRSVQRRLVIGEHVVLLVESGIGLVNAAGAATAALLRTRTRLLVSAGSAGGLGTDVRVGDVVVGTRYVYTSADARAFGYALGQVPGMPAAYEAHPELVRGAV